MRYSLNTVKYIVQNGTCKGLLCYSCPIPAHECSPVFLFSKSAEEVSEKIVALASPYLFDMLM